MFFRSLTRIAFRIAATAGLAIFAATAHSQNAFQDWAYYHAETAADDFSTGRAKSALDQDGFVHLAGGAHVVLVAPDGKQVWATHIGDQFFSAQDIQSDGSRNTYLLAHSVGGSGFRIIKVSSAGSVVFDRTIFLKPNDLTFFSSSERLAVATDGTVYVVGTCGEQNSQHDSFIQAVSSAGNRTWFKTWDGPTHHDDGAKFVRILPNGNIGVIVESQTLDLGVGGVAVLGYGPTGELLWTQQPSETVASSVIDADTSPNGDIFVLQANENSNVLHVDDNGNFKNRIVVSTGTSKIFRAIRCDASGGYLLIGSTEASAYVQRNSATDIESWSRTFLGPENISNVGMDGGTDSQGNVYLAASCQFTPKPGESETEPFLVKYTSTGDLVWPDSGGNYLHGGLSLVPNVFGDVLNVFVDATDSVHVVTVENLVASTGRSGDTWVGKFATKLAPCGLTFSAPFISTGTSTGTVWLSKPAPPGGQFVSTGCANPYALRAPLGFVIPEGAFSGTFTVSNGYPGYGINEADINAGFDAKVVVRPLFLYPQNGAQFIDQTVPSSKEVGKSYNVTLHFKNTGKTTWDAAHAYRLQSRNATNNTTWGTTRINLTNAPIAPNATGTFTALIKAPATAGSFNFQWLPIEDAINAGFGSLSTNVAVNVATVDNASFVSQTSFTAMKIGTSFSAHVTMKNTGSSTWTQALGYCLLSQDPSNNTTWGTNRLLIPSSASIAPNANADLSNSLTAPATPGTYAMQWRMYRNGVTFGQATPIQTITVVAAGDAQYQSESIPSSVKAGSTFTVRVTMMNTGTTAWTQAGGYCLISQDPFNNKVWGTNRLLIPSSASVTPGISVVCLNTLTAPLTPGTYTMRWQMSQSGVLFGQLTPSVSITVTP